MRKFLAVVVAGATALAAVKKYQDSQENRSTWQDSTDTVD